MNYLRFLDHVIDEMGIHPDLDKIQATYILSRLRYQPNTTELSSFRDGDLSKQVKHLTYPRKLSFERSLQYKK